MPLPLLLSLFSALATAFSQLLTRYVLRYAKTRDYLSVNFAVLFTLLIPLAPFFFEMEFSLRALGLLLVAAFIDWAANYFYFRAFEITEVSTASALLSLSPLFTLLISPLASAFVATNLTAQDVASVSLTVAGVVLLNRELRAGQKPGSPPTARDSRARLLIPLAASALLGINAYTMKYIFDHALMNPFTYYFLRLLIVAIFAHVVFRPQLDWVSFPALRAIAGRGIFVILKWMGMLYALELGEPPQVKAVSEIAPLFVVGLSLAILHERATPQKLGGVALIVGGLVLITV